MLTGHSHIYERSMLIDGAYHTPTIADGVVLDDGDGDPKGTARTARAPACIRTKGPCKSSPGTAARR